MDMSCFFCSSLKTSLKKECFFQWPPTWMGPVTVTEVPKLSDDIKYYFTRATGDLDIQLIKVIDSSRVTLDIAIYTLTKQTVTDAIIKARNRGVKVRIIADNEMAQTTWVIKQLDNLKELRIPIKENVHKGRMHLKIIIADNKIVTTGSYNYTKAATYDNDELLLIITNSGIATDFTKEFNAMWASPKYIAY